MTEKITKNDHGSWYTCRDSCQSPSEYTAVA